MKSPIIHHVSVIGSDRYAIFEFYHKILGLEFLLKTVNQDEIDMMHLFFGDESGRPGTEFSIFEMPAAPKKKFGTNALERTIFAVPSEESLIFWQKRFEQFNVFNCEVENVNGKNYLHFEDADGMQLGLTVLRTNDASEHNPHVVADIPKEHAIIGIDSFQSRVRYADASIRAFKKIFDLEVMDSYEHNGYNVTVLSREKALFGQQLHLIEDRKNPLEAQGIGSVQHIALNARSHNELLEIEEKILNINFRYSGIKYREFFESLYYREPNSLLIEVATEQTNFKKMPQDTSDYDKVPLILPDFLESKRAYIESLIKR